MNTCDSCGRTTKNKKNRNGDIYCSHCGGNYSSSKSKHLQMFKPFKI